MLIELIQIKNLKLNIVILKKKMLILILMKDIF